MSVDAVTKEILESVTQGQAPLMESLLTMHENTQARSGLDDRTYLLVRIAALVALDAPVESYVVHLAMAADVGLTAEDVRGVLIALGPVVGSARALSAADKATRAVNQA